MLHNRHVYHSIKEQNSNSAFRTHFGLRRTGEGPLNPHVLAQCSTTLESARHSHSRKRRVDRTSPTNSGSRLQCQRSNAWNSFRFTTLVLASIPQSNDRGIVTAGKPISPQPHHRTEFKPQPLRLCMHPTLSGASVILQHWMERQGRGHASHLWELSQLQLSAPGQLLEPTEI